MPDAAPPVDLAPPLDGNIDGLDSRFTVHGWVRAKRRAAAPVLILVTEDGRTVAEQVANLPRPDLASAGLGKGDHGFSIGLPDVLFDGATHNLQLVARSEGVSQGFGPVISVILPKSLRHARHRLLAQGGAGFRSALAAWCGSDAPGGTEALLAPLEEAVGRLAQTFGPAIALDMLYIYALGRPIDGHGLVTRLTMLEQGSRSFRGIIEDILASEEYVGRRAGRAPDPIEALSVWTDLRRWQLAA